MAANLIGTVGLWAIAAAETTLGIIIEGLDEDIKNEKKYIKDISGQRTGRSDYDEGIEVKITGKITSATPFTTKLGANITLGNTIATNCLYSNNTGRTLLGGVKKSAKNEDWRGIDITVDILPFFT